MLIPMLRLRHRQDAGVLNRHTTVPAILRAHFLQDTTDFQLSEPQLLLHTRRLGWGVVQLHPEFAQFTPRLVSALETKV